MVEPVQAPQETPQSPQPEAKAEATLSPELALKIAKQEKFLSTERQKLAEASKALEEVKKEAEQYKALRSKDPFEILEHFGVSYDRLLEADQQRRSPIDPMVKKALDTVEQLKQELSHKEQEAQRDRLSRADVKLTGLIDSTIKEHEFDIIEISKSQSAVRDYMEEMFRQTGELPDVKEACEAVTNDLVELYSKVKESKWLKPKEVEAAVQEVVKEKPKATSLSNKMVQSSAAKSPEPMTDRERIQAAMEVARATRRK